MSRSASKAIELEAPVLPSRDVVAFPHTTRPFAINRLRSLSLVEHLPVEETERVIIIALQRNGDDLDPGVRDLHPIGTIARVLHIVPTSQDGRGYALLAAAIKRARIIEEISHEPFLRARVELLDDLEPSIADPEYAALRDSLRKLFAAYIEKTPSVSNDVVSVIREAEDAGFLSDIVASALPRPAQERQRLLATTDVRERMRSLIEELIEENDKLDLENKIQSDVRERITKGQKEHLLREQMAAIQHELGEGKEGSDIDELREAIIKSKMPDEARKEAGRELARLVRIPEMSPEYTVARNYLGWLTALPWDRRSGGEINIARAQQILDEDHYDLEKVKERILEYLAVLRLRQELRGPILCFVGPPGVGKTSLGRSIARALGRQFARASLGGVSDEGELRGHRRTYVGSMPGQIIQTLRRVNVNDPVFMLDEVDKMGRDFRGDPAAALLEVLDPEQNDSFRDHYLDVPFDLSHVLFICTANVLDTVPPALIDRMEVLELSGYAEEEKLHIAKRYLVPRQVRENGLVPDTHIKFTDEGLREVARHYTREAGVRDLERQIAALARKQARRIASDQPGTMIVTAEVVANELGPPRHHIETEISQRTRRPGVAVGLAWTPTGGDVLFVEASLIAGGHGSVTLTGQLGQVMQESARAAITWLRVHADDYDIDVEKLREADLHIHVPAGAVPKDGPSAGLVLTAALMSAVTGQRVRSDVAMTGEITLSGDVLPVGGVREKVLAARRSGIYGIVLPRLNEVNIREDIPQEIRDEMTFHFVDGIEESLEHSFGGRPSAASSLDSESEMPLLPH